MDTFELLGTLNNHKVDTSTGGDLGSGYVVRAQVSDGALVAVGSDRSIDTRVQALVDGLHWHLRRFGSRGRLRCVIGRGEGDQEAVDAIAMLNSALSGRVDLQVEFDFVPDPMPLLPELDANPRRLRTWARLLEERSRSALPPALRELSGWYRELNPGPVHLGLRWHRSPSGGPWLGRVYGLPVALAAAGGESVLLELQQEDIWEIDRDARARFRRVAHLGRATFHSGEYARLAILLAELSRERATPGSPLHHCAPANRLEEELLGDAARAYVSEDRWLHASLAGAPFRLPVLWSPNGRVRSVDLLLRDGEVPYVVEVDVPLGGLGGTVRRAIRDAALARVFVRNATTLHPWFAAQGLDPDRCAAAVVIPRVRGPDAQALFAELQRLGRLLDVQVLEARFPSGG